MSRYISQYDSVSDTLSSDYFILQRGTAYKKIPRSDFFTSISNELNLGNNTLLGLNDVDSTYLSDGDTLVYNSATQKFECVVGGGGGASDLDDLNDVTITSLATNDVIAWNGTAYVNDSTYVRRTTGIADFIPRFTGTNTIEYGTLTDNGSAIGLNTATYTYSFNLGGNSARSIGMVRHTTSNTAGNSFSTYAGGATSGATNKDGGAYNIYAGISTGTGTSTINFYTSPTGSTGTADNTQTLKMSINGAGTTEITTSTANSKLRIGHNLKTVLSLSSGIGIELARVADGSYVINGGIYMVDNSTYRMIIASANAGVAFVKNPQTDTAAGTIINGLGGSGSFWCGVGNSGSYNFHFRRTWDNSGSSISSYFDATGTSAANNSPVAMYINNNITNSGTGTNFGLQINASGHSTSASNIALATIAGRTVFGATVADYDVSFGRGADRTFGVNRETSSTAGRSLTIYGGSGALAGTDLNGGNVIIVSGTSTGTGSSSIVFQTSTAGSSGTSDNTPTEKLRLTGDGILALGTASPNASAILDIVSTTKGLGVPVMTTSQKNAISTPRAGLIIFDTDLDKLVVRTSSTWDPLH